MSGVFSSEAAASDARRWLVGNRPAPKVVRAAARDANAAQTIAAAAGDRQRAGYWAAYRAELLAAIEAR